MPILQCKTCFATASCALGFAAFRSYGRARNAGKSYGALFTVAEKESYTRSKLPLSCAIAGRANLPRFANGPAEGFLPPHRIRRDPDDPPPLPWPPSACPTSDASASFNATWVGQPRYAPARAFHSSLSTCSARAPLRFRSPLSASGGGSGEGGLRCRRRPLPPQHPSPRLGEAREGLRSFLWPVVGSFGLTSPSRSYSSSATSFLSTVGLSSSAAWPHC